MVFLVKYRPATATRASYANGESRPSRPPASCSRSRSGYDPRVRGSGIWGAVKKSTPPPAESLNVKLIAQQFAWNFQYPGPDGQFGRRSAALVTAENSIGLDPEDPASKDDIVTINQLQFRCKPTILRDDVEGRDPTFES